jgi:hypothetical protein
MRVFKYDDANILEQYNSSVEVLLPNWSLKHRKHLYVEQFVSNRKSHRNSGR